MRYFFNLTGAIYDPDNEGFEFETATEARIMAVRSAADLLRDRPEVVWSDDEIRVEVTDASQLVLFTVIVVGVVSPMGGHLR